MDGEVTLGQMSSWELKSTRKSILLFVRKISSTRKRSLRCQTVIYRDNWNVKFYCPFVEIV